VNQRQILFVITILLGFVGSLYYGWVKAPVDISDAEPSLLRADFRADYALMVAEAYQADQDVDRAVASLAFLNPENVLVPVEAALTFGQEHGFSPDDIASLAALAEALREYDPGLAATPTP
jgi:hypothetical protein